MGGVGGTGGVAGQPSADSMRLANLRYAAEHGGIVTPAGASSRGIQGVAVELESDAAGKPVLTATLEVLVGVFVVANGVEMIAAGFEVTSAGLAAGRVTGGATWLVVPAGFVIVTAGTVQIGVGSNIIASACEKAAPFPDLPGAR